VSLWFRLLPFLAALTLLPHLAFAADRPLGEVRYYTSAIDGSRQAYGLYLPSANPPSERGYPVVMHAHGYGWYAGADFSPWQRQWADDHGWVLVNVNGRGPNFYDGIGEDDVLRVLDDVAALVALDRTRLFITGGSMGGTGAYRMGVRRPDVFSAASPVDGWTDYRLFHKHWYERQDMPGAIEEFRRPLLEAASPFWVAGTARWTKVQLITDGQDNVVDPDEGLRLNQALCEEQSHTPDAYHHELVLNYDLGHGGGYDIERIYRYFLGASGLERPPAVSIETTLLRYGSVHWAHLDRFRLQGAMGRLDVEVADSVAHAITQNLEAFGLRLADSPLRDRDRVQVVADGLPCYDGPPADVAFTAVRDGAGTVLRWAPATTEAPTLTKRRGLEGPIGEAFLRPFVVVYGAAGETSAVLRAKSEADDFAREWNAFNVHYDAVAARPEDELSADDLKTKDLILFGTLDDSSLLRRMDAAAELPVRVFAGRVCVRDPVNGDRTYAGDKYGAYWVYPNPLSGFHTLVVGLKGHFRTTADGGVQRGLGYDLEKLPWAWGDYVVFDSDPSDLAYVGNVNNKASTLCYEAGYFVEAGFFDPDWRPDRSLELARVRALRPEGSKLVHVETVEPFADGVRVRVVDEGGAPQPFARVTLSWAGAPERTFSRPTDRDGFAFFAAPAGALRATVVNVCPTGATYAHADDRAHSVARVPGESNDVTASVSPPDSQVFEGGCASFVIRLRNQGTRPAMVVITAPSGPGYISPLTEAIAVAPGGAGEARFVWDAGSLAPGEYSLPLAIRAEAQGLPLAVSAATVRVFVAGLAQPTVEVAKVAAPDRNLGERWEVLAEVRNKDTASPSTVTVGCVLVEAHRYLPTQTVRLEPGGAVTVRWQQPEGTAPLDLGIYTARVSVLDLDGAAGQTQFVVK
jgi:hypothetical protein